MKSECERTDSLPSVTFVALTVGYFLSVFVRVKRQPVRVLLGNERVSAASEYRFWYWLTSAKHFP